MKKLIAFIALGVLLIPVLARDPHPISDVIPKEPEARSTYTRQPPYKILKYTDDTVYCTNTNTLWQWQLPVDSNPKYKAIRGSNLVRLSIRNKNGRYTRVETMLDGEPVSGCYTMSVSNIAPEYLSDEVKQIQENAVRLDLLSDGSGKKVLQERYYGDSGELLGFLVYQYLDSNIFVEYAYNALGLPIPLLNAETDKGQGIKLKHEQNEKGTDTVRYFVRGCEIFTLPDGVAGSLYRESSNESTDSLILISADGKQVNGSAGYCARIINRDKRGDILSVKYTDAEFKPITKSTEWAQAPVTKYAYDSLGRVTERSFFDGDGAKINGYDGTHRLILRYGKFGLETQAVYDKDGKPTNTPTFSKMEREYDSKGNLISVKYTDKDGRPVVSEDLPAVEAYEYGRGGEYAQSFDYYGEDGEIASKYRYRKTPRCATWLYQTGKRDSNIYDAKGRIMGEYSFEADGAPDSTSEYVTTLYSYSGKRGARHTKIERYDREGRIRQIEIDDSLRWTATFLDYYNEGYLRDSRIAYYTPGYDHLISLQNIDSMYNAGRILNGGVLYYRIYSERTPDSKNWAKIEAIDEFGEPDYEYTFDLTVFSTRLDFPDETSVYLDEDDKIIMNQDTAFKKLPKLMSIAVTRKGEASGLRTNDIILAYGSYNARPNLSLADAMADWSLHAVVESSRPKTATVFRVVGSEGNRRGVVLKINLPEGTPSQIGFQTYITVKTRKQMDRIACTARDADVVLPYLGDGSQQIPDRNFGKITVGYKYPFYANNNSGTEFDSITAPVVMLKARLSDFGGVNWNMHEGYERLAKLKVLANPENDLPMGADYYYTTDGKTMRKLHADNDFSLIIFSDISATDSIVHALEALETPADTRHVVVDTTMMQWNDEYRAKLNTVALQLWKYDFNEEAYSIDSTLFSLGDFRPTGRLVQDFLYGYGVPASEERALEIAYTANESGWPRGYDEIVSHCYRIDSVEQALNVTALLHEKGIGLSYENEKRYSDYLAATDSVRAADELALAVLRYHWRYVDDGINMGRLQADLDSLGDKYKAQQGAARLFRVANRGWAYLSDDSCVTLLREGFAMRGEYTSGNEYADNRIYIYLADNRGNAALNEIYTKFMADKLPCMTVVDDPETPSPARDRGLKGSYYMLEFNDWDDDYPQSWFTYKDSEHETTRLVLMKNGKIEEYKFGPKAGMLGSLITVDAIERETVLAKWRKWRSRKSGK